MQPFHLKFYLLPKDWIALGLTLALLGLHLLVPRLRRQRVIPEIWIASFGAGFVSAYVFLHLLPGFEQNRQAIGALLADHYKMTPLRDLWVYFTALLGFVLYFGLQRRAEEKSKGEGPSKFDFYLHLAALGVLNFIITYTMAVRVEVGLDFAILFTLVMGLDFVILDRNLEAHFPMYFDHQGRLLLGIALLLGWALAALTEPNNVMLIALLSSFLGGSVLFNVFHNEIPASGRSSFPAFTVGVGVGCLLLILITALQYRS
jgi:hypothetical protein